MNLLQKKYWTVYIIIIVCFSLYGNTLSHKYALDDAIVITQNDFTKKGVDGIWDHLTNDSFTGFFKQEKKLVSGGRYRPLTYITYSLEYELFKEAPGISHFINVVLYIFTALLLFIILKRLFPSDDSNFINIPFVATLLFIVHPIHTEVVANIKGRDEILTLLASLGALYYAIEYIDDKKKHIKNIVWISVLMFLGLMAKETAIAFVLIIPFTLYIFRSLAFKKQTLIILSLLFATSIFLIIRFSVVGFTISGEVKELMNNPFLGMTINEKYGTILYTLWRYIELLFVPHPLTFDYYPYHVEISEILSLKPMLAILVHSVMLYFAINTFTSKSIIGYGSIIYLSSLFLVSNLLIPVGSFMNERFLFVPTVGFVIVLAYYFMKLYNNTQPAMLKKMIVFGGIILLMFGSAYTIDRNKAWKNDLTLFTTDVKTSYRSAKATCTAGGKLWEYSKTIVDSIDRIDTLLLSKKYLLQSIKNYKTIINDGIYVDAELLLGNCYFDLGEFDSTLYHYKQVCKKASVHDKVYGNAIITINRFDDIDKKIEEAEAFFAFNPNDFQLNYNLGKWYGQYKNNIDTAIYFLQRAAYVNKKSKEAYKDLGVAYGFKQRYNDAINALKIALQLDPKDDNIYYNLAITYSYLKDYKSALQYFEYLANKYPDNTRYRENYEITKQYLSLNNKKQ